MMLVERLPVLLLGLFVLSLADYGTGSENMGEIITSLENISEILFNNGYNSWGNTLRKAIILLKEQDELLRKLQKDKDKLCLEISEWKHKYHDAPPKFVSQGVVNQICWERDTALSQLEQIGKGLGSKMDDIVALLEEQEHGETFTVIDTKTGKEADEYEIALHEDWAKHLCYCDMEGWAIENDGTLLLVDECGQYACADRERFKVVWDA